jgi:uncharacterized C2H2 Zn-finger protein
MAKEIVAWCDIHLAKDEQVVASSVRAALDNGMPMDLDLCEACDKELVEPLRLALIEYGQPVRGADEEESNMLHCPMPGCRKSFPTGRKLQKHMERIHDTLLPDSVLGPAQVAQVTTTDENGEPIYSCPECDRTFRSPQGVGAHRSKVHGYRSPTKAES